MNSSNRTCSLARAPRSVGNCGNYMQLACIVVNECFAFAVNFAAWNSGVSAVIRSFAKQDLRTHAAASSAVQVSARGRK